MDLGRDGPAVAGDGQSGAAFHQNRGDGRYFGLHDGEAFAARTYVGNDDPVEFVGNVVFLPVGRAVPVGGAARGAALPGIDGLGETAAGGKQEGKKYGNEAFRFHSGQVVIGEEVFTVTGLQN